MPTVYDAEKSGADTIKTFRELRLKQKLQFLWDYYKLPLAVLCIVIYIAAYSIHSYFTHKDTALYTALVNVAAGEDLTQNLTDVFLESTDADLSKNTCQLYSGLYLTEDENNIYHEYTYASRMKILAAIDAEQMDLVLMDKEAFDAFSQNGYLYDLDSFVSKDSLLYQTLCPYFTENTVILEDNSLDLYFNDTDVYQAETKTYPMGIDLSASPVIQKAGFSDTVYLGIIKNTSHKETVLEFLHYLYGLNMDEIWMKCSSAETAALLKKIK